jgi:hypothetical protein
MKVFERLVGLCSLECFEAFLVHRQVAFPISSGGIRLIVLEVIALIAYSESWALIFPIITSMFLFDFFPFLLEVIDASNLGLFPFQVRLKST